MSNNTIDITPNASKTIESLRHLTYTNVSALADIVDNSLDAHASNVTVSISDDPKKTEQIITIIDDGMGMSLETMNEAIKLGSDTEKGGSDLGRFGMGLVTASISMARRLEVISKLEGTSPNKVVLDLDEISNSNTWSANTEDLSSAEQALFENLDSGTMVIMKKVDSLQYKLPSTLIKNVKESFSEIFRQYLNANTTMTINGETLKPIDPLELWRPNGTEVMFDDDIEFKDGKISVKFVMLDHTGSDEARHRGYNITNQGVYVVRNMRQIARAVELGLFKKHNDFNRMRIEVSYNSELDDYFGINFTKNELVPSQALVDKLLSNLQQFISLARNRAKANQRADDSKQIDHKEAEDVITRKSKLLKTKDVLKEKRGPRVNTGEDKEPKDPTTTKRRENIRKFQQGGRSVSVKFTEVDLGTTGDLYRIDFDGPMLEIGWNISHPFHSGMVAKYSGDKDVSLPLDFFLYSLATAELSVANDDNLMLVEQIRSTLSSNLRVLMQ